MIILERGVREQGSNRDKRSDSEYILKVEWREFVERLGYERKTGLRMSLVFWPEH